MSQPFVISYKITGDGRAGVEAAREVRQEVEALQRSTTRLATGRSAGGIDAMLGVGSGRGTTQARADVDAYGKALDDLRANFVPLFSLERQHEANLSAIAGAYRVGAISADEQAAAIARESAAHQRAVAALDGHTHAINANAAANGRAMAQRTNLIFQLNDIFVSLASGMNPAMVAIQQGSQIATIYGPGEGGIGAAFRETGKMAAGAATKFWPIALAAAAIGVAVGGMRHEIEETSGVAVSFGDTFMAVFQVLGGYLYNAFRSQIEAVQGFFAWLWDGVVAATKAAVNFMIRSVLTFVEQVRVVHDAVPLIFQLAGEAAANGFISSIEWLVQKTLEGIDTLIMGVNDFINMFGGDALRDALGWDLSVPQLVDPNKPFSLGVKFNIDETKAELAAVGKNYTDAIAAIAGTDYVGEFFSDVQQQAIANYNAGLEDTDKKATKAAQGGLKDLKSAAEEVADAFNSAFSGIGSGLFEALKKGGDVASSVLDMLIGKAEKFAMSLLDAQFDSAVQGSGNWLISTIMGAITGSAPGFSYAAGVTGDPWAGLRMNAKGGVYSAPALSAYSNTVVDKPTLFAFARGGVMGEAGEEAIVPLVRTASGNLGVRSVGGNAHGQAANDRPMQIDVINNSSVSVRKEEVEGSGGRRQQLIVEDMVASTYRPGSPVGAAARAAGTVRRF